jgi:hypothetical protein
MTIFRLTNEIVCDKFQMNSEGLRNLLMYSRLCHITSLSMIGVLALSGLITVGRCLVLNIEGTVELSWDQVFGLRTYLDEELELNGSGTVKTQWGRHWLGDRERNGSNPVEWQDKYRWFE